MSEQFSVQIVTHGRGGAITYHEGAHSHEFAWEFSGGRTLVVISAPDPKRWADELLWAVGRREEVLDRIAREVVRQKAPGCSYVVHAGGIDIVQAAQA